jgi:hypothetical protein
MMAIEIPQPSMTISSRRRSANGTNRLSNSGTAQLMCSTVNLFYREIIRAADGQIAPPRPVIEFAVL